MPCSPPWKICSSQGRPYSIIFPAIITGLIAGTNLSYRLCQMHPGNREPFRFSWKDIPQTGLGTKDFIAPDSFDFRQSRSFRIGQYWGAVSYLQILASELSDKLLAEILEMDAEMTVTPVSYTHLDFGSEKDYQ